ncbi:IS3 family transposase [Massilia sp. CFBP9012]|uniref:IS3 family transposase n=1 Tax=Massilia sp. CFBP9012 TaxID=3096531 RepID=UPI0039C92EE0
MKYDEQFKFSAVEAYLVGPAGFTKVAQQLDISASLLRSWVARYRLHGIAGLAMRVWKAHSAEFKLSVLKHMWDNALSYRQAAAVFNLPNASHIGEWERRHKQDGFEGLKRRRNENPRMKALPPPPTRVPVDETNCSHHDLVEEVKRLRAENAYLKKLKALVESVACASEKTQVILELRLEHGLTYLLEAASLARSTFFYQKKVLEAGDKDAQVKEEIQTEFHRHHGRYGYRRITAALRQAGRIINHKAVQRLMGELGLKSLVRPKKYKSYKADAMEASEDVLQRDFEADRPNEKWVTDVTEFKVDGRKVYLSPIMDLYNREIVAYEIRERPSLELVSDMLEQALSKLEEHERPILHSDQGWQYRMPAFRHALDKGELKQSMSRKGNCHDNAAMESFFAVLKSEFYHLNKFSSVEQLVSGLKQYINYYNHDRIKIKLNGLSPVQYRAQAV